eukprot:2940040-Prymnesium_polylepis.1
MRRATSLPLVRRLRQSGSRRAAWGRTSFRVPISKRRRLPCSMAMPTMGSTAPPGGVTSECWIFFLGRAGVRGRVG